MSAREQGAPAGDETQQGSSFIGGFPSDYLPAPFPMPAGVPMTENADRWAPDPPMTLGERQAQNLGGAYERGDEWMFANEDPPAIAHLQGMLAEAGLLDDGDEFSYGWYDDTTREAVEDLLAYSNGTGLTWDRALQRLRSNPLPRRSSDGGGRQRAPLTIQLTNPDDLKAVFRSVAREVIGQGNIDPAQLDRMVTSFQQQEATYQRQAYSASESGGTVKAPPSLEVFANQQARELDPTKADARKVVAAADFLARKLRGEA